MLVDIFPTNIEEWHPVESLSGTFSAIHKGISDAMYPYEMSSFFLNMVFFFFIAYKVSSRARSYRDLEFLPILALSSLHKEESDRGTITSFKSKLSQDSLKAMTPSRISRRTKIQWFAPLHAFVSYFKYIQLNKTKSMWLNRRLV